MNRVFLMYHSIGASQNAEAGARLYSVPLKMFEQQIEHLAKVASLKQGQLPKVDIRVQYFKESPYLITFDDGDITNYKYAYPILKEFGLKGYFFIILSKIGTPGYMNWEQIRELRDGGMIIGSHGITHRILTELKDKELDYELNESKKILEEKLGQPIDYLSIPRGFYNKKIINLAREAGYKAVFTSNQKDLDRFKVGRIPVKCNWDLEYFKKVINNGFSLKGRAEELIKNTSKKMLGAKNYDKLRSRILSKQREFPKDSSDIANSRRAPV